MIPASSLQGRRAVVLGLGATGLSLARHLHGRGAHITVADTRPAPPFAAELRAALPAVTLKTGPFGAPTLAGADLIAISPGIPRSEPAIAAAVARGVELVGDIELFARALPAGQKLLAITGSNGKTTVTALTGALCRAAGLATVVAGNIGDPALDALARQEALATWPDVFVLELSSFQLETTASLTPVAASVLNVTDNHLDRYAGIDAYGAAKARIFDGGGTQVLNRDDARSLAMRRAGRVVETFGAGMPGVEHEWGLVARADEQRGARRDVWLARGGRLLVPAGDMRLVGQHNALNALAALALVSAVTPIRSEVLDALSTFESLPHRMQRVGEARGVLFVNDSKATTVTATRVALEGLARPVVLIAGGDGKGQDFAPLRAAVDAHCTTVLLIGRDAVLLERALRGTTARVEQAGVLGAALDRALEVARPGDAIVLSPACASLDQFTSYVERGETFIALVQARAGELARA